jgi:hypothetical protein
LYYCCCRRCENAIVHDRQGHRFVCTRSVSRGKGWVVVLCRYILCDAKSFILCVFAQWCAPMPPGQQPPHAYNQTQPIRGHYELQCDELQCCGVYFKNKGNLVQHQLWHRFLAVEERKAFLDRVPNPRLNRKSYTLKFKAKVMKQYDNERGLRCKSCSALLVPGSFVNDNDKSNEVDATNCFQWDAGCDCGCKKYIREKEFDVDIAKQNGISKSMLSEWLKRKHAFLVVVKMYANMKKLVNDILFP